MKKAFATAALAFAALTTPALAGVELEVLGTYETGIFDEGAAEIVAHEPGSQRLFVINADAASVDVLDASDPANLVKLFSIDATAYGDGANSVAVRPAEPGRMAMVAVAIEAPVAQDNGVVAFFNVNGDFLGTVEVGALPDMVTFTPNGNKVLVANEGEPDDDYVVDPVGSVSIIDIENGVAGATVLTAGFEAYNNAVLDPSIRIFGPGASVAQDLEPEYIVVSRNSKKAWVVCQENNAIGVIDVRFGTVTDLFGLGTKDHSLPGNALDASNRDDAINITNWPVKGFFQPDAIALYRYRGQNYIVTANEGDARDYDGFSEEARIKDLMLDPMVFPNATELQEDENLGRLNSTTVNGDTDGDGYVEELFSYGARSFSIFSAGGKLIYDSGDDFERITAQIDPDNFNSNNDDNDSFDARSDDKGPEPEGVVVGKIRNRTYAFIGLERVGGIMVYDITNPFSPSFETYIQNRDFSADETSPEAGDLGPEGLAFIPAGDSPTGGPLLVVGNEVSGTTTVYAVNVVGKGSRSARDEVTTAAPATGNGAKTFGLK